MTEQKSIATGCIGSLSVNVFAAPQEDSFEIAIETQDEAYDPYLVVEVSDARAVCLTLSRKDAGQLGELLMKFAAEEASSLVFYKTPSEIASKIISAIGTVALAEYLDMSPTTISCWKNRGIPRRYGKEIYVRLVQAGRADLAELIPTEQKEAWL